MTILKRTTTAFAIAVISLFIFNNSASASTYKVVSTTNFYGEVAKQVLGKYGKVKSIISSPDVDPHDFEPTTKTAKDVASANLVIYNGAGYDTWVTKLQHKKMLNVSKLMNVKDGDNEHIWYNSKTMATLADKLAKDFAKAQPNHKKQFEANAAKYIKKLDKLQKQLSVIKKNNKKQNVAVSEPVFNYALQDMGYKVINEHFAMAIEEGNDPSYSDIKKLQNAIKNKKIAFFVLNTQSEGRAVNSIAKLCKQNHIPLVKVTETKPAKKTYIQWMSSQYTQVEKIIKEAK